MPSNQIVPTATFATSHRLHRAASGACVPPAAHAKSKRPSGATDQFHQFLITSGMPTVVESIRREHIEAFEVAVMESAVILRLSRTGSAAPRRSSGGWSKRANCASPRWRG